MTAVESCPRCGKSQRSASLRCDYCSALFDHCIEPPPRAWPVSLWWISVIVGIVLLSFLVARSLWASQAIIEEVSLETTVAQSPVIVLARRVGTNPMVLHSAHQGSVTEFRIWTFEIIDGYRHLCRNVLPGRINVIQAYAEQDAKVHGADGKDSPGIYVRQHYKAADPLRLEEAGPDPVILFLTFSQGLNLAPDQPGDLFELQYVNSIEKASMQNRIVEMIRTSDGIQTE